MHCNKVILTIGYSVIGLRGLAETAVLDPAINLVAKMLSSFTVFKKSITNIYKWNRSLSFVKLHKPCQSHEIIKVL